MISEYSNNYNYMYIFYMYLATDGITWASSAHLSSSPSYTYIQYTVWTWNTYCYSQVPIISPLPPVLQPYIFKHNEEHHRHVLYHYYVCCMQQHSVCWAFFHSLTPLSSSPRIMSGPPCLDTCGPSFWRVSSSQPGVCSHCCGSSWVDGAQGSCQEWGTAGILHHLVHHRYWHRVRAWAHFSVLYVWVTKQRKVRNNVTHVTVRKKSISFSIINY